MRTLLLQILFIALSAVTYSQDNALNFDGNGDYAQTTNLNVLSTGDMTIEMMIKSCTSGSDAFVFASEGVIVCQVNASGQVRFFFDGSGGGSPNPYHNANLNDGDWHHIAATHDVSANLTRVYVDGALMGTQSESLPNLTGWSRYTTLGSQHNGSGTKFRGSIDEFRVWDRVRTATEIANNSCSVPTTDGDLQLYYKFDQAPASTTITDVAGAAGQGGVDGMNLVGVESNEDWVAGACLASCLSTVTVFPALEDFEGWGGTTAATSQGAFLFTYQASGWKNVGGCDDYNWRYDNGGTSSGSTGPTTGAGGSTNYLYVEGSSPRVAGDEAWLESPCYDLTGLTAPKVDFYRHMYGASMGNLELLVGTGPTYSIWTPVWSAAGNAGNSWNLESVDLSAYAGQTIKLRFRNLMTATGSTTDAAIDDVVVYDDITPMTYSSSTVTQLSTADVQLCQSNAQIIGVEVVTAGSVSPISISQIILQTTGSTNPLVDISNIDIYYTGTSNVFATTTLFGSTAPATTGVNIPVNGGQVLANGTNYFWIVYDMNAVGTATNLVDGLCNQITVGGSNYVPTVTSPAGSRTLVDCSSSPGGVPSDLELWVKANVDVNGGAPADGALVDTWDDQSALNNDFAQGTNNNKPIYRESSHGYPNFNPTIEFDGAQGGVLGDYLTNSTLNLDINASLLGVWFFQPQNGAGSWSRPVISAQEGFAGGTTTNYGFHLSAGRTTTPYSIVAAIPAQSQYGIGWSNSPVLDYNYHIGGMNNTSRDMEVTENGIVRISGSHSGSVPGGIYTTGYDIGGNSTALGGSGVSNLQTRWYKGYIGEIIAYDEELSPTLLRRVESYLAIKYGITLGNNGTSLDYTSTAGSTVWSAALNAGYAWDVAGIARDVITDQDQPKSHSINKQNSALISPLRDIVTVSNGSHGSSTVDFATTTPLANDQSFLMWGHNNGALINTGWGITFPTDNGEIMEALLTRQWKSQESGTVNSVTLEFDLSAIVGAGAIIGNNNLADVRLLVDEDGDFMTDATAYAPTSFDNSTNLVYFEHDFIPSSGTESDSHRGYYFTLASIDYNAAPLPVELISFVGECDEVQNTLSWATASETNSQSFEVQRMDEFNQWETIGEIAAAGYSNTTWEYSFQDRTPLPGLSYYRLIQIDMDGVEHITKSIVINSNDCGRFEMMVYPNPGNELVSVLISHDTPTELEVFDMYGRMVYNTTMTQIEQINTIDWEDGIYTIRINDKTERLVITH